MAGTYSGGYHGTGDFEFTATTGAEIARNHAILRANAERNRARASAGSDRVVQKKDVVKKTKLKKRKPAAGSGPGNVVVGDAPTTGPGLGVITPNVTEDGELLPVGGGPGNPVVGAALTTGPAAGVGTVGHTAGWFVGPDGVVTAGDGGEERTSVQVGGVWVQPHPGFSDMNMIEQRYGDDGPIAMLAPLVIGIADGWNTLDKALGSPRASMNWDKLKVPKDIGVDRSYLGSVGRRSGW